jgi:hypothetical protein
LMLVAAEPERLALAERRMATAVPPASSAGLTKREPHDKRFKLRGIMLFERARVFEAAVAAELVLIETGMGVLP